MGDKGDFPNNLKKLMDPKGFSQRELSVISEVSMSYVNELYNQKIPGSAKKQGQVVTGLIKLFKLKDLAAPSLETKDVFPNGTKHNPIS